MTTAVDDQHIITVRGSSADRAWVCPESAIRIGDEIDHVSDPAEEGSAFHAWARGIDDTTQPDIHMVAGRFGVDADSLGKLCAYAMRAWTEFLEEKFTGCKTETPMETVIPINHAKYKALRIAATIDMHCVKGDVAFVNDWKTGRVEGGYEHQLRAAALNIVRDNPSVDKVQVVTTWVRLKYFETATYTRDELEAWAEDMAWRVQNGIDKFTPGTHCQYCPRANTCHAASSYRSQCMKMFDDGNIPVSGIDVKATLEQVKYIESECAAWKRSLRAFIEEEGAYDNGDGTQIILQAQNRRTILPREAWPILVDAIGEDALSEAMTISITKVEKIVAANAPKTFGAKAKRELYDTLVEAGAIRLKESKSIRVVPVTT